MGELQKKKKKKKKVKEMRVLNGRIEKKTKQKKKQGHKDDLSHISNQL